MDQAGTEQVAGENEVSPQGLHDAKSFIRNIIRLGTGTAVGQLAVVASSPLLTRLYLPVDIGLAGYLISFILFASPVIGLRYDLAIVDAKTDQDAKALLVGASIAALPVSAMASIIYLAMIHWDILKYGRLSPVSSLLVFAILSSSGFFFIFRMWHARNHDFSGVAKALAFQGLGRAAFPILVAPLHGGWESLALAELVGRSVGLYRITVGTLPILREAVSRGFKHIAQACRRYWKYPLILGPSALIDSLQGFLPIPLVGLFYGPVAAGYLALLMRVSTLPSALITQSVSDVLHSRLAGINRQGPKELAAALSHAVGGLSKLSLLVYVPMVVASPFAFGFVFGEKWALAGPACAWMSAAAAVNLIVSPTTRILNVVGRQSWKIMSDFPRVIIPTVALCLSAHLGRSFTAAVAAYSVALIIVSLLLLMLVRLAASLAGRPPELAKPEVATALTLN